MKTAIIEELLLPVSEIISELKIDKHSRVKLELALNKVRSDLDDFLGEVFDHEDPYGDAGFQAGFDDEEQQGDLF